MKIVILISRLTVIFLIHSVLFLSFTDAGLFEDIKKLNKPHNEIQKKIIEQHVILPQKLFRGDSNPERFIKKDKTNGRSLLDEEAFNKRFMSSENNPISKTRRGAYATGSLRTNHYYGWLVEFQIKEQYRHPKHVASVVALPMDPRFKEWFDQKNAINRFSQNAPKLFQTAEEFSDVFKTFCLFDRGENEPRREFSQFAWVFEGSAETEEALNFYIDAFRQAGLDLHQDDLRKRISWCDDVASSFLDEYQIKFVLDEMESFYPAEAFYIRDPQCIEKVTSTPEEWLELLTSVDYQPLFVHDLETPDVENGKNVFRLAHFIEEILRRSSVKLSLEAAQNLLNNMQFLPYSLSNDTEAKDAYNRVQELIKTFIVLRQ